MDNGTLFQALRQVVMLVTGVPECIPAPETDAELGGVPDAPAPSGPYAAIRIGPATLRGQAHVNRTTQPGNLVNVQVVNQLEQACSIQFFRGTANNYARRLMQADKRPDVWQLLWLNELGWANVGPVNNLSAIQSDRMEERAEITVYIRTAEVWDGDINSIERAGVSVENSDGDTLSTISVVSPDAPPEQADIDALQAALDQATALNQFDYTASTWVAVDSAVIAGLAVQADPFASVHDYQQATRDILNALDGLVLFLPSLGAVGAYSVAPTYFGDQVLFKDSNATDPVTADGDEVGTVLDVGQGLARGTDVFTGGYNLGSAPSATLEGEYVNWAGSDGNEYIGVPVSPAVADGLLYEFEIEVTRYVQGDISGRLKTGTITPVGIDGVGTFRVYVKTGGGSFNAVYDDGVVDMTFRVVSIREVQGAHLYQPTSLSKPTYHTDGVRHWLRSAGDGDTMASAALFDIRFGMTGVAAFSPEAPGDSGTYDVITVRATTTRYSTLSARTNVGRIVCGCRFGSTPGGVSVTSVYAAADQPFIAAVARQNAASNDLFYSVDGSPNETTTNAQLAVEAIVVQGPITILDPNFSVPVKFYGGVQFDRDTTDEEATRLLEWAKSLRGDA